MKNALFTVFRILVALVLLGKILNWFLDFSAEINQLLNSAMFSLIGIAYLVMGYVWEQKLVKIVITACGSFLLLMNLFGNNTAVSIIGLICMVTPMIIARLYQKNSAGMNAPKI